MNNLLSGSLLPVAEQTVGNTPVLRTDDGYWAKLEGFNFGGIKDRAALYMVEQAHAAR